MNRQQRQHGFGRQILELDIHVDFAKVIALAFVERKRDDKAVPVRRKFGYRRYHPEIGVSFCKIEFAQQLPVIGQSIRIIAVIRR